MVIDWFYSDTKFVNVIEIILLKRYGEELPCEPIRNVKEKISVASLKFVIFVPEIHDFTILPSIKFNKHVVPGVYNENVTLWIAFRHFTLVSHSNLLCNTTFLKASIPFFNQDFYIKICFIVIFLLFLLYLNTHEISWIFEQELMFFVI
jgi:hypothetical protein